MQFYFYALSFLVLGVLFSLSEYICINYPKLSDTDDFDDIAIIVAPSLLALAFLALIFMVCEILHPGITLSTVWRHHIEFVGGSDTAFVFLFMMWYNFCDSLES